MLPPVIYMHILKSSHSGSHSGGSIELPSEGCLGEIFQKSLFHKHFLSSLRGPLRGALWAPYGPPARRPVPPPTAATATALRAWGWLAAGAGLALGWL